MEQFKQLSFRLTISVFVIALKSFKILEHSAKFYFVKVKAVGGENLEP